MTSSRPTHRLKRKARLLSRARQIPLHAALDHVAAEEGFASWSLLAARRAEAGPAPAFYARLAPGDLVLVAARPGQGKTLLGLRLALEAMRAGRPGVVFTLEYTPGEVAERLRRIGAEAHLVDGLFELDSSDVICADHIAARLDRRPRGTLAVVDYLQLLDQRRSHPDLDTQLRALAAFARERGMILVFISQIDRSYDPAAKPFPGFGDVRRPNPIDLSLFRKALFLNAGRVRFEAAG